MSYLEAFGAPDIMDIDSTLRWQLQAGVIFQARQMPASSKTSRLLLGYLIVVDKAIREYRSGHACVSEHMAAGGGIPSYIEGVGHFENCINATKRALRLLNRLAGQPDAPGVDRTVRRLAEVWSSKVTDVRDAIEHIEDDIVNGQGLPDGSPHLLTISEDGLLLEVGTETVTFDALASTVRALYHAGAEMLQSPPSANAAADA